MERERGITITIKGNGVLPCVGGSRFDKKYRIVTDTYNGYEVQAKRWWFPFWLECNRVGCVNSFTTIERAKMWIEDGCPKARYKHEIVDVS